MQDDLVCSDFCEEHGFPRAADLLRATSGAAHQVHVVLERGAEYNDEIMDPHQGGHPSSFFLDRDEAERVAAVKNADWHRFHNILDYCYELKDITDLSPSELEREISAILGTPFNLANNGRPTFADSEGPLIPETATQGQAIAIADLFRKKFFYVETIEIAASS